MSSSLAEKLAAVIVNHGEDAASALVGVVYAVSDPNGDPARYELARIIIRQAIPLVPGYDELCDSHCREVLKERPSVIQAFAG